MGGPPVSLTNIMEKAKAVNDYSIIIQEYFKSRVTYFLENYAKEVLGTHPYYVRFEFTKSRGEINVLILAMLGKKLMINELNELVYKDKHNEEKQAQVAADWMINVFHLASIHPGSSTSGILDTPKIGKPEGICENPVLHPPSQKLSAATYYNLDMCNMCNFCKMHNCSGYYLYHHQRRSKETG
jgi:hypothetical protein